MKNINQYKPAVSKNILLLLAGIIWACVGVMLLGLAFSWLAPVSRADFCVLGGSGIFFALLIHHFGFLRIVDRNLERILPMEEKHCLFGFIPVKSYLIIAIMIVMGTILRHSAIPRPYLAIIYTSIGLALVLSSVRYLRMFFQSGKDRTCLP
jgi:hypothetical protein